MEQTMTTTTIPPMTATTPPTDFIDTPLEVPALHRIGSIYLPIFYNNKTMMHVAVLETYGRPIRYFETANDPMMKIPKRYCTIEVKLGDTIRLGEAFSWMLTYSISYVDDFYYINQTPGLKLIPITKVDDLYKDQMPVEMREAILQICVKAAQ